jgi:hypothetical protein
VSIAPEAVTEVLSIRISIGSAAGGVITSSG